jgi:hypothetical protein
VTLASDYAQQVLDPRIAFIISSILSDNAARTPAMGANSPLYTPNLPTSVKTGTSNDFRDNWTVGYTRNVVVGVWTGNADNTPMNNVSGIQGAAPIWNSVINGVYNNQTLRAAITTGQADDAHLQPPEGVHQTQLCNARSLQNPATSCPPGFTEWVLDTPPAAPDSNGSLVIQAPTQAPYMGDTGPQPLEVEPSIIRVAVFPVRQDYANAIAAQDSSGHTAPPQYCQVPIEAVSQIPGVQDQFFIAPPLEHDDAYYARMYAQQANLAILPEFACNSEMLAAGAGPSGGQVVVANITSPAPGQTVSNSGNIDIIGSAVFSPDQAAFYKVEIQGGPFAEFTTLGDVNNWQNRAGGSNIVLASIMAGALPPGSYTIQLTVVAPDGNWVQQPYQVQFNVG